MVLVVNIVNDLAEIDRPNLGRHTALDGFAARVDPGAPPRASSPLRTRAIQRSHAAFALWRWARTREAESVNLPPDPGFAGLLSLATRVAAESRVVDEARRDEARRAGAQLDAERVFEDARRDVLRLVREHRRLIVYTDLWKREWDAYLRADGAPGDEIFPISFGGCAPPPPEWYGRRRYSSNVRYEGSRIQRDVEDQLQEMARGLIPEKRREIEEAFARRAAARRALDALPTTPLPPPPAAEPLPTAAFFAQAAALAATHAARLVVVVAPLDAQASAEARRRRSLSDAETAALDVLAAEIALAGGAAGALGVDTSTALRAAGASAFLPDGHLSPAGHEIVARTVAAALASPSGGAG